MVESGPEAVWSAAYSKPTLRRLTEKIRREGAGGFLEKKLRNMEGGEVRKNPALLDWRHWCECMVL